MFGASGSTEMAGATNTTSSVLVKDVESTSRWDWVEAPTKKGETPEARFQHVAVFAHTKLIIGM